MTNADNLVPLEDIEREQRREAEALPMYELLSLGAVAKLPPPTYLINKLLTKTGLATIFGTPGSGKSFVALDIALCVALDFNWLDIGTTPGSVIYIAGEGVGGMTKRVKAWQQHHDCYEDRGFHLIRDSVGLLDEGGDVAKLVRTLDPIAPISLTVIDTLARSFVGGDENSSQDMGRFIAACDQIREITLSIGVEL